MEHSKEINYPRYKSTKQYLGIVLDNKGKEIDVFCICDKIHLVSNLNNPIHKQNSLICTVKELSSNIENYLYVPY